MAQISAFHIHKWFHFQHLMFLLHIVWLIPLQGLESKQTNKNKTKQRDSGEFKHLMLHSCWRGKMNFPALALLRLQHYFLNVSTFTHVHLTQYFMRDLKIFFQMVISLEYWCWFSMSSAVLLFLQSSCWNHSTIAIDLLKYCVFNRYWEKENECITKVLYWA